MAFCMIDKFLWIFWMDFFVYGGQVPWLYSEGGLGRVDWFWGGGRDRGAGLGRHHRATRALQQGGHRGSPPVTVQSDTIGKPCQRIVTKLFSTHLNSLKRSQSTKQNRDSFELPQLNGHNSELTQLNHNSELPQLNHNSELPQLNGLNSELP